MEPLADPSPAPPTPSGRKSALAFFGVLLALYLPGAVAQSVLRPLGLAWSEIFAFLLSAMIATAGSNLRAGPYLRLGPARPVALVLGALAGVAGYLFAGSIMVLTQRLVPARWVEIFDPAQLFEGGLSERLLLALVATALAPLCEEIAFRGYLQTTLMLRRRPSVAIAAAAVLFALMHLNPVLFPALVVLGALFGWLTWRAGSLWPAVLAHAANNAITSSLVLGLGLEAPETKPAPLSAIAASMVFGGAALFLVLIAYHAATPRPPPAWDSVALRDPADPSIRFSPARVPAPLAAAALAGLALLAGMLVVGAMGAAPRRGA